MPIESGVSRKRIHSEQVVELSIELAPYIMAYKNYKNVLDNQKGSTNSKQELFYKATYEDLRNGLMDSLSPLTGGSLAAVFDLAMDTEKLTRLRSVAKVIDERLNYNEALKKSSVYEALDDSFVEILSNAVDDTIKKYLESSKSARPINTLKATLQITIDDHTNPDNLTISCFHKKGGGFKESFLQQVSTLEERKGYISTVSSNKLSEAKLWADIPLYIGGRGQGLRMLMRKIDEGRYSESDRKHATKFYKAPVSNIEFSNKMDVFGKAEGAVITITTSKQPVVMEQSGNAKIKGRDTREVIRDMKQRNMNTKSPSTIAIDVDFLNAKDAPKSDKHGSASPLGMDLDFLNDNSDDDQYSSASPTIKK